MSEPTLPPLPAIDPRTQTEVHPDVVAGYIAPGPRVAFWAPTGAGAGAGGSQEAAPNYSFSEQDTGTTWIDGKKVYQKTVDCGALPASGQVAVPHGIANLAFVVGLEGFSAGTDQTYVRIPHVDPNNIAYQVGSYIDQTNVEILVGSDRSAYTASYVTIRYTCTDR